MAEPNTLYVQMFGNFRMKYGEKPLTGEKIRDTYFTSLMQILLHNVPGGVSGGCAFQREGYGEPPSGAPDYHI